MKILICSENTIAIKLAIIITIIFLALHISSKTKKVCLCAIAKNENLYAKEFVEYYINLGYSHIFIYDNNNIDGENIKDLFINEIKLRKVSVINYRGFTGTKGNPQLETYYDCYKKNNKNYQWLSFFDFDEFLVLQNKNIKIENYFNDKIFNNCDAIKLNWIIYTDNNLLHYEKKPLIKRFTEAAYQIFENIHTKTTARGNLGINYWNDATNAHSSRNNYFKACTSSGKPINNSSPFNKPIEFKNAYLKHFFTKTVEEYCEKINRGRTYLAANEDTKYKYLMIQLFFNINKKTEEKIEIFENKLNISLGYYKNSSLKNV